MKRFQIRSTAGRGTIMVPIVLGVLAAVGSADTDNQYVKANNGQRPRPIVAVDNVCAWPNLTVLRDRTIIATIFNRPSHGQMAGDVECWGSEDGGRSWQKRGTPAVHEPQTNRMNIAAGLANNGELIVISSGWSNRYGPGRSGRPFRAGILEPWVCRSSDGGRTWTVDKTAFPPKGPRGGDVIPFGDILPGNDGMLRVAIYEVLKLRNDRVYIYRSQDDGKTWGEPVAMDEKNFRNETAMLHLGDGKWLAAARGKGLHLYASSDDAKTWKYRMRLSEPPQHPGHLLRLPTGRLLATYGNRTANRGVDVRLSKDEGISWGNPIRVVDFQSDGGYPASLQTPNGQVLTAYYARKIEGHDRYHMGVVIWDLAASLEKVKPD